MTFEVLTTPEAERNLRAAFAIIYDDSPAQAGKWLVGIRRAIRRLSVFPGRCARAREHRYYPSRLLKQQVHQSHRIVFEIDEARRMVRILHVRHASMRTLGEPGCDEL
jgi:plasmid stabilization system protein ParE